MTTIHELPKEVLLEIFKQLSIKTLKECRTTCKDFQQMALRATFKNCQLNILDAFSCPLIETLVEEDRPEIFLKLVDHLCIASKSDIDRSYSSGTALCYIAQAKDKCSSAKTIKIANYWLLQDDFRRGFLKQGYGKWTSLEDISLDWYKSGNGETITEACYRFYVEMALHFKFTLKSLVFCNIFDRDTNSACFDLLVQKLGEFKYIQHLTFVVKKNESIFGYEAIIDQFSDQLKSLKFVSHEASDSSTNEISNTFVDKDISNIKILPRLEQLEIEMQIDNDLSFEYLMHRFPNVTKLKVTRERASSPMFELSECVARQFIDYLVNIQDVKIENLRVNSSIVDLMAKFAEKQENAQHSLNLCYSPDSISWLVNTLPDNNVSYISTAICKKSFFEKSKSSSEKNTIITYDMNMRYTSSTIKELMMSVVPHLTELRILFKNYNSKDGAMEERDYLGHESTIYNKLKILEIENPESGKEEGRHNNISPECLIDMFPNLSKLCIHGNIFELPENVINRFATYLAHIQELEMKDIQVSSGLLGLVAEFAKYQKDSDHSLELCYSCITDGGRSNPLSISKKLLSGQTESAKSKNHIIYSATTDYKTDRLLQTLGPFLTELKVYTRVSGKIESSMNKKSYLQQISTVCHRLKSLKIESFPLTTSISSENSKDVLMDQIVEYLIKRDDFEIKQLDAITGSELTKKLARTTAHHFIVLHGQHEGFMIEERHDSRSRYGSRHGSNPRFGTAPATDRKLMIICKELSSQRPGARETTTIYSSDSVVTYKLCLTGNNQHTEEVLATVAPHLTKLKIFPIQEDGLNGIFRLEGRDLYNIFDRYSNNLKILEIENYSIDMRGFNKTTKSGSVIEELILVNGTVDLQTLLTLIDSLPNLKELKLVDVKKSRNFSENLYSCHDTLSFDDFPLEKVPVESKHLLQGLSKFSKTQCFYRPGKDDGCFSIEILYRRRW